MRLAVLALLLCAILVSPAASADAPAMKFNEVKEVAPGVFFRYSAISPTDPNIFGGSNNIWVVFDDYVAVIDANFPKEAEDVLAAVRKTTSKPVRYVLDTHHHGDHAYGNAVWARAGATIVSSARTAEILRRDGPREFAEAGKGPTGRKDIAASSLSVPTLVFDEKLVLDDGKQRLEFLHLGHAHTVGDAVAFLPKHRILCTGDACVNGAYNFMGHSDSASWIRTLERMQGLGVTTVLPGHGAIAGKELLEKQKRYFAEMRVAVRKGIDSGKEVADVIKGFKPAWYREWTGVEPSPDNVKHVYGEFTGKVAPWDLTEDFDLHEGPSPTKETPGWTKPKRIVVPGGLMPRRLGELKLLAPDVEFVPVKSATEAARAAEGADAVLGFGSPQVVKASKTLRWVQIDEDATPALLGELKERPAVLTRLATLGAVQEADEAFSLLLDLTRTRNPKAPLVELRGKTLLVVGLGSTGKQVARRASAFGMRVIALEDRKISKPDFVLEVAPLADIEKHLPRADVLVLASPLTEATRRLVNAKHLGQMKKSAWLIDVGPLGLVDPEALASALEGGRLGGAGLAAAWEHLKVEGGLVEKPGVVVSKTATPSQESRDRQWRLFRENVRRFVAGEPLLFVVPVR